MGRDPHGTFDSQCSRLHDSLTCVQRFHGSGLSAPSDVRTCRGYAGKAACAGMRQSTKSLGSGCSSKLRTFEMSAVRCCCPGTAAEMREAEGFAVIEPRLLQGALRSPPSCAHPLLSGHQSRWGLFLLDVTLRTGCSFAFALVRCRQRAVQATARCAIHHSERKLMYHHPSELPLTRER